MRALTIKRQGGAVLLLVIFIIALATTAYAVKVFDTTDLRAERDKQSTNVLLDSKAALIGASLSGTDGSGARPGDMPYPDRLVESTVDYDGETDSCIGSAATMNCLGRLPWRTIGMNIVSPSQSDIGGRMPWYAVSANLVDPTCLAVLNPGILSLAYTGYTCNGETLPHRWLTVRDKSGNILSSRVAFVIILPGTPVNGQSRSLGALGTATEYLDTVIVPADCRAPCVPGTYSNADADDDFIQGTINEAFNDRLLYVTIDEYMKHVQSRVLAEVKKQLLVFKGSNGNFPDAATIGYQGRSCVKNQVAGFLPLPICSCVSGAVCDCAFPAKITFTQDKNYQSSTGSCSYSGTVCTCTGSGSCARSSSNTRSFTCNKNGTCSSNVTGTFVYQPQAPIETNSAMMQTDSTNNCSVNIATGEVTCNNSGYLLISESGATGLSAPNFPVWFAANGWKHYVYYAKGALTVGSQPASALVVGVGDALNGQVRPSGNLVNYLDSEENTNQDNVFDAMRTKMTNTYNDQPLIVAP